MLHVTNGDHAVEALSPAISGEWLPWRDVLHEGPVFAGLPLGELSRRRAAFVAGAGWATRQEAERRFAERDAALAAAPAHDEVVLWFEHDLYDQLQLVQLLDWFAAHPHPRLTLVCEAEYLGTMTPARAGELFRERRAVRAAQLREASAAWSALGSAQPQRIVPDSCGELRFLGAALRRFLEEYPWRGDGLSRLERQALEALRDGPLAPDELYARAHQRREDPVFLGDTVLFWHLERLARDGLLMSGDGGFRLSAAGEEVLAGKADAWDRPRAPRWLGGYEMRDARLRWDPGLARLVRRA